MSTSSNEGASAARSGSSLKAPWAVVGGIGLAGALGLSALILLPGAAATPSDFVTICHATSSTSNPYTVNTINTSSVDEAGNKYLNGHGNHTGPVFAPGMTSGWGDIIPAFESPTGTSFPGYNYDGAGQAILSAGCAITSPSPTPTETSPTPTPTETSPTPTPTETSPTPTPTETSPTPTPTETSPTPTPITTSPAPITTSPAPITTSPAPLVTTNPNPPTGGYPQAVPAGGGPADLSGANSVRSGWLWLAVFALLALSLASFGQLIRARDDR